MKSLANCNPLEFLVQTNRIRKSVETWLSLTKVMEIRRRAPQIDETATQEEKRGALQKQAQENIRAMLDAILGEYPKETAELLCLVNFVEPEDMEKHTMTELIGGLNELLENQEVVGFFTSLMQSGLMGGSG